MSAVHDFEQAFAEYVGAEYAIALCNGTATLHTALAALGVKPGDEVAVPPLTMASTSIAVLHTGAVPVFVDVEPDTWLMEVDDHGTDVVMPVSLYGLVEPAWDGSGVVVDAAQTLARWPSVGCDGFVSYSFQASKILALGEGGMLVTDDEELARRAREFSSLGYRMDADRPAIDKAALKHPTHERHHSLGWNYRMSDEVARRGWRGVRSDDWNPTGAMHPDLPEGGLLLFNIKADAHLANRRYCAHLYAEAVAGVDWITPQHVPDGWTHDYWAYAVALESAELWEPFTEAVVRYGGEMPYGAWRLTYQEPAFRHLAGHCPVAEDLQPRLVQFQTNDIDSAERNAFAVAAAIGEIGG